MKRRASAFATRRSPVEGRAPAAGPRTIRPVRLTLANGLQVLAVENPALPSIAATLTVLAGARDDAEERAGAAVMASRLFDEGTRTRSSLEIADAIESVGGALECDCGYDRTSVFLSLLDKDIELGLELAADVIANPTFSADSLENERDRMLTEIRSAMDRPQVLAGWEFNELIYQGHPLHRPVHGYAATIERITPADLQQFHRERFSPANALFSIVGNFSTEDLLPALERTLGRWDAAARSGRRDEPPVRQQERRRGFIPTPTQQAHVYLGHLGVNRTHPDFYALQVMDSILGGGAGLTARIPRKLRDEDGLAYTTFASITASAGADPGKFLAYIGTSPENVDLAIEGFIREIGRIMSEPVEREELQDAQAYLTGSFVFAFESNAQIARFLVNAELFDLGFDYAERYPGYIESVTVEDVLRVARTHLSTEHYTLVIAGPERTRSAAGMV